MEQFSLCWNSFRENLAEGFQSLYENGELFDVVIVCDGKEFKAHRDILAACSPFFRSILVGNSSGNPIIILNDVPEYVMKLLLRFIYYGSVIVNNADLSTLMKHAEKLRIKGLTQRHRAHPEDSPEGPAERSTPPGTGTGPLGGSPYNGYGGPAAVATGTGGGGSDDPTPDGAAPPSAQPLYSVLVNTFLGRAGAGCEDGPSVALKQPKLERSAESVSPYPPADYGDAAQPFDGSTRSLAGPGHADHVEQQLDALRPLFPSAYDCTAAVPGAASLPPRSMPGGDLSLSSPPLPDGPGMDAPLSPSGAPVSMNVPAVAPGEKWFQGRLQFMLSQRGKPLLVHDGHSFGIQYIRKDKKYWQCNLSRKYNCKARVTTTDTGDIIVTNNEHCHTEIRQHLRKDYKTMKLAATLAASRASFEATNLAVASTSSSSAATSSDFYIGPVAAPPVTADQEMRSLNLSWTFNRESNKCND
ncbi:zinc finger and BTB domain-containing protein 7A-like [Anopheles cruzii]|uniref:zinc finger and BTB domain-containing protein 7A-like n=1 Tax=Anopheles cruzii TaxID=68878 RepID=UPI0022EC53B9|nr:zinc finger and BTB domain-containing protein 7A-like [Anopheles cruzii]